MLYPVGEHYRGKVKHLFFTMDNDVNDSSADAVFSNVRVYEDGDYESGSG